MQVILFRLPRNTPLKQPAYPPTQRTTHLHSFAHYPFAWQSHFAVRPEKRRALVSASCKAAAIQGTAHGPPATRRQ
jgi:hypothetical protein